MLIKRSIKCNGNIGPEVYDLLHNLPDEKLSYKDFRKGHPIAIYNTSLERIMKAFSGVLDVYEKITENTCEIPTSNFLSLLELQKELLHSLHSHFDDCHQILKVTSPYPNTKEIKENQLKRLERSSDYWLNYFKHPSIKYFTEKTRYYRSSLGKIVNKIKHDQARLRGITQKIDNDLCIGYFVEVIDLNKDNLARMPESKIHPLGTSFSFARDIQLNFYNLYEISHHLKKSLIHSFKEDHDLKLQSSKNTIDYPDFAGISKRISNLHMNFFLDEYSKPHPLIKYFEQEKNKILVMKLDVPWYKPPIPNVIEVNWLYEHDGITEYCAVPYFDYLLRKYPLKEIPKMW